MPDDYNKPCWDPLQGMMSYTSNNKELVSLFPVLNKLFIYDIKKDSVVDKIVFHSDYVNEIKQLSRCDPDNNEKFNKYLKKTAKYQNVIYNRYNDTYYIFVLLPMKHEEIKDANYNFEEVMPFSIIVLDNNFKKLTEKKFKAKTYLIKDYFVTEEGLWISNNNVKSKSFDENKLSFSLFKLEKK